MKTLILALTMLVLGCCKPTPQPYLCRGCQPLIDKPSTHPLPPEPDPVPPWEE